MEYARVHTPESTREVTNLGWLLAHKHDVKSLSYIRPYGEMPGQMLARLNNGARYECTYESESVWRRFIVRPSWDGIEYRVVSWCGELDEEGTVTRNGLQVESML